MSSPTMQRTKTLSSTFRVEVSNEAPSITSPAATAFAIEGSSLVRSEAFNNDLHFNYTHSIRTTLHASNDQRVMISHGKRNVPGVAGDSRHSSFDVDYPRPWMHVKHLERKTLGGQIGMTAIGPSAFTKTASAPLLRPLTSGAEGLVSGLLPSLSGSSLEIAAAGQGRHRTSDHGKLKSGPCVSFRSQPDLQAVHTSVPIGIAAFGTGAEGALLPSVDKDLAVISAKRGSHGLSR